MTVMIGNARISEYGTVNGKKGDQTGREVMTQPWSTGGTWTYVIRPKSSTAAEKIAKAMKAACGNPNIGYSQADRMSLNIKAMANGYKLGKVGTCNCDCSSLVAVCCRAAGIMVNPYMYTGNELQLLRQTGKFHILTGAEYTKASGKLKTGDILLRAGHTAIVTEGAVKAVKKTTSKIDKAAREVIEGKYGNGDKRVKKLKAAGFTAAEIKKIQSRVNDLMK